MYCGQSGYFSNKPRILSFTYVKITTDVTNVVVMKLPVYIMSIYHKGKIKCDKDLSVNAKHKFRSFNCYTAKHILEYIKLMPAILLLLMSQVTVSRS